MSKGARAAGAWTAPALWLVIVPVAIGGAIYVLWRPETLRLFEWIGIVGLGDVSHALRETAESGEQRMPEWVVYSLPNALWAFAWMSAVFLLWRSGPRMNRRAWVAVVVAIVIGSELGQWVGAVPGTFDIADLASASCALACAPVAVRKWS